MTLRDDHLLAAQELAARQNDGLEMFRAISPEIAPGYPDQVGFFKCDATEILARGGNRSSKTTSCAVRCAAVARDKDIVMWNGERVPGRLPHQKGRPLTIWLIGLQLNHIGHTMHRVLFRPGLYKIILDKETYKWRAFRPWDEEDQKRAHECKPSFPLIPPSEIEEWSWEKKAENQFNLCKLKNGTEIYAYASTADVKQGDPVDYIWIDERIAIVEHYPEWLMRLPDRKGRIVWSSLSRRENTAMMDLTERAERQKEEFELGLRDKVEVVEYKFTFSGNPFIDDEEKEKKREQLGEAELKNRDEGEYLTDNILIYPFFDKRLHAALPPDKEMDDAIAKAIRANGGRAPREWTHELILDPGTAKPAVLMCAVPPLGVSGGEPAYVVYDELYIPRLPAERLAKMVRERTQPGVQYYRFIIDGQAARQKPMGFAKTIGENYAEAFEKAGVLCHQTGSWFTPGDPDFPSRSMIVTNWLQPRNDGKPSLRVVIENCPNLVWQLSNNYLEFKGDFVGGKPAPRQKDDLRVCLEYWASRHPKYVTYERKDSRPTVYERDQAVLNMLFNRSGEKPDRFVCGPAA